MKKEQRLYQERIMADPRILAGKPVVKGTRIAVGLVLEELAQNLAIDELLAAHPDLSRTDVQACLAYAKDIVTGEEVSPKPPKKRSQAKAQPVTSDDALFRLIGIGHSGKGDISENKHKYLAEAYLHHK
jgi:uncharacterized protein (DUF433 family)